MNLRARLIILGLFFYTPLFSSDIYQSIRIFDPIPEKLRIIGSLGIPLDHINWKRDVFIDLILTKNERIALARKGIESTILINDLSAHYKSNNRSLQSRDFPLGSMQGNYTWDELNSRFDELNLLYPNIISERIIIGQSVEGRDIWAFKVSDNPNLNEKEVTNYQYLRLRNTLFTLGILVY